MSSNCADLHSAPMVLKNFLGTPLDIHNRKGTSPLPDLSPLVMKLLPRFHGYWCQQMTASPRNVQALHYQCMLHVYTNCMSNIQAHSFKNDKTLQIAIKLKMLKQTKLKHRCHTHMDKLML